MTEYRHLPGRRKLAEEKLRILSRVVEQSPNSIVITDRNGDIEYVNPRFEELTGYTSEEVIGQNPRIFKSNTTPNEVYREMWGLILQGKEWRGEICNRKKNGELFWEYSVISGLFDSNGKITHFIAVKIDITENKKNVEAINQYKNHLESLVEVRTNELLEAKEAAEVANKAKSTFLANMSHEIRTPMNGVLGMADILLRKNLTPEQMRYVNIIKDSGVHLLGVINNILDISKIEAGMILLEEKPVDINVSLANAVSIQSTTAKSKGLELVISETINWPGNLAGDRSHLQQALINLIGNAVKFTETGSISVSARIESETRDNLMVYFEVKDTGIGISSEDTTRVFNIFEQADSSTTRKYGGTGLGLSIVKRISNLMGGHAGVKSVLGVGSTFWFTACLKKVEIRPNILRQDEGTPTEEILQKYHKDKKILIVDDEPINRYVVVEALNLIGLRVDTAQNGKEAVQMCKMSKYHLILMDMQMPILDGLDATSEIRKLPNYQDTPIIAVTANVFSEDREKCMASGMSDYMMKPFRTESLFDMILKWL